MDPVKETPKQHSLRSRSVSAKFKEELRNKYYKQQNRKVKATPALNPSVDLSLDEFVAFSEHLKTSTRILALFGAGLSAASGIPTFRGPGGFWRTYDATELASPSAFKRDPSLVWQFYSYRRHQALKAKPNRAHVALAKLAKQKPGFLAISQNIDGLSPRAGHTAPYIEFIHGSLFNVRCSDPECDFQEANFTDPIVPALQLPDDVDIKDAKVPLKDVPLSELPHCPKCTTNLLRPDVVWFGEAVPRGVIDRVDAWVAQGPIDLMLVIGTQASVYPAAGYIPVARLHGARVAVVDMERRHEDDIGREQEGDWFFQGDAAVLVPELLKAVIGKIPDAKLED